MKKITTIFLAAFLLGACTDNGTPSGGAGSNDTPGGVLADFNYKNYPDTLTVISTKDSANFIKLIPQGNNKSLIQGVFPYPIINKPIPNGFHDWVHLGQSYNDNGDGNNWVEILINSSEFHIILADSSAENRFPINLFNGKEVNQEYIDKNQFASKGDLCLIYYITDGKEPITNKISVYYKQTGPKTLKKVAYEKIINGDTIEDIETESCY